MFLLKLTQYSIIMLLLTFIQPGFTQHAHAAAATCHDNTPGQMTNRFTDLEDGTVLDTQTKLIWQRCNLGQVWHSESASCQSFTKNRNWRDSLVAIKGYNDSLFASNLADDWRMPNIKELASILDISCPGLAIDTDVFLDTQAAYWSSTPSAANISEKKIFDDNNVLIGYQDENQAWTIDTNNGTEKTEALSQVRSTILVRGPSEPSNQ